MKTNSSTNHDVISECESTDFPSGSSSADICRPTYAEMVPECKRWNICRGKAFEYSRLGLIETFTMGRKRYVMLASLASLPARLRAMQGGEK